MIYPLSTAPKSAAYPMGFKISSNTLSIPQPAFRSHYQTKTKLHNQSSFCVSLHRSKPRRMYPIRGRTRKRSCHSILTAPGFTVTKMSACLVTWVRFMFSWTHLASASQPHSATDGWTAIPIRPSTSFMKYLATLFLTCSVSAFGQELLYTYSGHVTDISQDSAGIIGASGIHVGDSLAVTFLVDFSRPGYYIQNDGTTVFPGSGPHDTIQYHYYYDRLLTDLPIHEKDGGSLNAPMDAASLHYAYDNFGIAQSFSSMGIQHGGSDNATLNIVKSDSLNATIRT